MTLKSIAPNGFVLVVEDVHMGTFSVREFAANYEHLKSAMQPFNTLGTALDNIRASMKLYGVSGSVVAVVVRGNTVKAYRVYRNSLEVISETIEYPETVMKNIIDGYEPTQEIMTTSAISEPPVVIIEPVAEEPKPDKVIYKPIDTPASKTENRRLNELISGNAALAKATRQLIQRLQMVAEPDTIDIKVMTDANAVLQKYGGGEITILNKNVRP